MEGISLQDIIAMQHEGAGLIARAEESGSEGCYVEVARYKNRTCCRYCFFKCFGGEILDEMNSRETAECIARVINNAGNTQLSSLIHHLPDYKS